MKHTNKIKWILISLAIIYIINGLHTSYAKAMSIKQEEQALQDATRLIEAMSVSEMIEHIAPQFGQSPGVIKTIVCSESNFLVLPHDGGQATNVTGIWNSTFKGWLPLYEKETGETLNINSTYDQIKMMSWAFSKGDSYRYQWSTYHAYIKGGQARIWSRYYGKHFDIKIQKHCRF